MWRTHEVFNQVPVLSDCNLFDTDIALREAVVREGAGWHAEALRGQGEVLGSADTQRLAELADRHVPELVAYDRCGRRVDDVDFHPAWARLLGMLYADGVHSSAWFEPRPGAHVARAASFFLHGQAEAGSLCPVTMTFASIPVLRREPALFGVLGDKFRSRDYDGRDVPLAGKRSVMIGMGMTEKQGGSDLRANTTRARLLGAGGRDYALVGHKWFFSVPTCDAHLVLAQASAGPSCFFVPRWLPDGSRNAVRIRRLKDKLGNRSNASAEVEFEDAFGTLVGDEGRGIATIMEMAAQTRLDCVLGSAALMRRALVEAIHHARHRSAFGQVLVAQPLMRNVLADLALESEAATILAMRLAKAVEAGDDPLERAWRRIVTPAAKFWVCKRAIAFVAECMEVWGGNGYVEDGPMARLYREAPVNSIWEGSGNVMCLDVLRAVAREPDGSEALLRELSPVVAAEPTLAGTLNELAALLRSPDEMQWRGRHVAMQLVLLAQAALLLKHAPATTAAAFIASRLGQRSGQVAGLLAEPAAAALLIDRAWPG
ncbi:isovaleryl-CoA dehydrogenase [Aromatoleum bremense]|uniref:Isovaleryl-CoA dehydrogenase n=1 Tax=Aromatoleum bremense TaxID=76115 RepID=A0ABX1P154_9RHOO|nr:isovaleryl-CoA dehydrogenase [Aromatoleum bremense]NMG17647.1 isovaleryl-CoA dehydrogenase [Aromatoleum bremense]QTQ31259.1 Acyl-CoA dehydrogenase [Aromatoleum bremense]